MNWSKYQTGVFEFVETGSGNAFVNAGPGSGKTTVIEEAVLRIPSSESVLVAAFNVSIRDELEGRFFGMPHITVHNFNRFGNQLVRQNVRGYVKVDKEKTVNTLFFEVFQGKDTPAEDKKFYYKVRHSVAKIISLLKSKMIWTPTDDDIIGIAMDYDIKLPDDIYKFLELTKATYKLGWEKRNKIDFDDQLAMPIYYDWDIPQFDWVWVDESQDLNPVQIELMMRAMKPGGRAGFVGDPHQGIYQFRGADKHAIQTVIDRLACTVLPLSICYRCSRAVVSEAAKIYPDIEVNPDAVEGSVRTIERSDLCSEVNGGDFILCRTGAPLVAECLNLIGEGKLAVVKGRDLGDDLEDMLPDSDISIPEFLVGLRTEWEPVIAKYQAAEKPDKALNIQDRLDCLVELAARCSSSEGIRRKIHEIFHDNVAANRIVLMTVHKSKGLEANNVFILRPDLMPHPKASDLEAESNIKWVATTRAKVNLTYVKEPPKHETRTEEH